MDAHNHPPNPFLPPFCPNPNCLYHNTYRREKRCRQTPAMLKGMLDRPLRVQDVLKERLLRTRIKLPERWAEYYERLVVTPVLGRNRRHELKYAF